MTRDEKYEVLVPLSKKPGDEDAVFSLRTICNTGDVKESLPVKGHAIVAMALIAIANELAEMNRIRQQEFSRVKYYDANPDERKRNGAY